MDLNVVHVLMATITRKRKKKLATLKEKVHVTVKTQKFERRFL